MLCCSRGKAGRRARCATLVVPPVRLALGQALPFRGCLLALIVTLWNITPLFHHRLSHLPWIHLRADADLLWNIETDFNLLKPGCELGDVLACGLRIEIARLLRLIPHYGLGSFKTFLWTFLETATCRATELHWDLEMVQKI